MNAREYFDSVRASVLAYRRLRARVAYMRSRCGVRAQRLDAMPRGSGASDPMDAVDERMDAEAAAAEEARRLLASVDDGRAVCRGVRLANPSMRWGDVLEARYCDAMDWSDVARVSYVSESRARSDAAAALEWLDMVGIASARDGRGSSEL